MSKKTFVYEFEPQGPSRITLDYSLEEDELLDVNTEAGVAHLYLNRTGMLTLAKWLIKMAEGDFGKGYHLHINKDFSGGYELLERLVVYRTPDA